MTIEDRKLFSQGKDFWHQYVYLNGYSFRPTRDGLKKLSKNLDINIGYLSKCIYVFLET